MEDRYERMNFFIKTMANTYKDVDLNSLNQEALSSDIYHNLVRLGVKRNDKKEDFKEKGYFNNWVNNFYRRPTDVFVSESWNYFCQFLNTKNEEYIGKEHIKLYIPQDADHIEKSAELIFDHLEKRDAFHASKIGKKARFDDIVIRLENAQDAEDLVEFVNKNEYISEGLIAANPFAFNYKGIAHACDRDLSYNCTIADMLTSYLIDRKEKNVLDKASLNDFVKYTKSYYVEHFIEKKKLGEVIGDFRLIKSSDNSYDTNKLLVNTKNIIELYLKGLNPNFTINDYYQEYYNRCDYENIKKEALEFQNARAKESEFVFDVSPVDNFLFEAVRISINRFKELEDDEIKSDSYYEKRALSNINEYLKSNNNLYLTRSENLRDDAKNSNFRDDMVNVLNQNNLNLYDYFNYKKSIKSKADFNNAILQTYEKYQDRYEQGFSELDGTEWCVNAIKGYLANNNTFGFTRENNARYNLERYSSRDTAREMIEKFVGHRLESQKDLENYVQGIVNKQEEKKIY